MSTVPRQQKVEESSAQPDPERGRKQDYQYIASLEELKKAGQVTRWINDHDILLYDYKGDIKALSNVCRHFGGPVGYHKRKTECLPACGTTGASPARTAPACPIQDFHYADIR